MSRDNPIGQPFVQLTEVQSSNNYAMAQVQAQLAAHGATWFAHSQTAGKGQRGKAWLAEPGQNITMSIVIEPSPLLVTDQFKLSAAIAVACHDFFSSLALDECTIKWPNDIYWKDRKAGGILIENILHGSQWKYAIVGIGININQTNFPPGLVNPVSLKQITGKTSETVLLAKELCKHIDRRWQQLISSGPEGVLTDYNARLYKLDETVQFKKDGLRIRATVKGVSKQGELIIENGREERLPFGSVEWVIG